MANSDKVMFWSVYLGQWDDISLWCSHVQE